ncbi:Cof-type HAD-IIB family hydrolase [Niallia endozanthoxylica]|uniref:HAD family phosphatase n=1 Tax=Niallia endozanthoxylica TaxID=2036016 RepID=A0A5J5H4B7_9BACI|nr:Cof-type HAD-IIB family hydrolase [Niallia endozanthoxylica]KAA9014542.1 HAD family phosphatase [Niallia endozanthoxylica]
MKLIASDLDGTLLNEIGEISQENIQAIIKAEEKGLTFVVATGRSYDSAKRILTKAGILCPIICLNGAAAYDINGRLIRNIPMDAAVCRKIVSVCQKAEMYTELFMENSVLSSGKDNFMDVAIQMFKNVMPNSTEEEIRHVVERRFQDENVQFTDNLEKQISNENNTIYKVLSFSLDEKKLAEAYNELKNEPGMIITSSGHMNLEFNHPDAKKGLALKELVNSMGIDMRDVMALGDNLNDKSMLEEVGRGVAMGNAAEEIKELCKYTTKRNTEHGVAYAIEEMLRDCSL